MYVETSKNEDTWCEIFRHYRCRIKYSPKSSAVQQNQGVVTMDGISHKSQLGRQPQRSLPQLERW